MSEEEKGGVSFRDYRQLILAHIQSSNQRHDAMEDAITELRVQMGVLVVKVGLIVTLVALVGGAVTTVLVNSSVKAAAEKIIEEGK